MDKSYYETEITNLLTDKDFYKQPDSDSYQKLKKDNSKLITSDENGFTEDEIEYLMNFERKESNFYGLPKIHKSKEVSEKCNNCGSKNIEISQNEEISFRQIEAGPTNETHRRSNLVDIILKQMTKHFKSFIRDSTDFLNHLPTTVSPNSILASFDVESLYSNIPLVLVLEAIEYWLNKHPEEVPNRINKDFIKGEFQFIVKNNKFYFNGKYYNQVKGTAMGQSVPLPLRRYS